MTAPTPHTLTIPMAGLEVTLQADSPEHLEAMRLALPQVQDPTPIQRALRFRLEPGHPPWLRLYEDDAPYGLPMEDLGEVVQHIALTAEHVVRELHAERTCLHSASATIDGRLALFSGPRGSGKTTLMLRLLLDGAAFHGDEYVLTDGTGRVRSIPRRLRVKPGTFFCLPEVGEHCARLPASARGWVDGYHALDSRDIGYPWQPTEGPPAAIFHLEAGFDEPPVITPIAQIDMVSRLLEQLITDRNSVRGHIGDVCALVRGTPCFALRVGDPQATAAAVREVLHGLEPEPAGVPEEVTAP